MRDAILVVQIRIQHFRITELMVTFTPLRRSRQFPALATLNTRKRHGLRRTYNRRRVGVANKRLVSSKRDTTHENHLREGGSSIEIRIRPSSAFARLYPFAMMLKVGVCSAWNPRNALWDCPRSRVRG